MPNEQDSVAADIFSSIAREKPKVAPRGDSLGRTEAAAEAEPSQKGKEKNSGPTADYPDLDKTMTVRLDKTVKQEIKGLCAREGITPETLFEGFIATVSGKPREKAIAEAKKRVQLRKDAGVRRRVQAQLHRLEE